jgi:hypothetical protein
MSINKYSNLFITELQGRKKCSEKIKSCEFLETKPVGAGRARQWGPMHLPAPWNYLWTQEPSCTQDGFANEC